MKKCIFCSKEIDDVDKMCSHCGKEQKKNKNIWFWLFVIIAVVVLGDMLQSINERLATKPMGERPIDLMKLNVNAHKFNESIFRKEFNRFKNHLASHYDILLSTGEPPEYNYKTLVIIVGDEWYKTSFLQKKKIVEFIGYNYNQIRMNSGAIINSKYCTEVILFDRLNLMLAKYDESGARIFK
ncbi:MAG: hypothetical protein WC624_02020 [Candidatus Margulisiibacteriota bacterium]